MTQDEQHNDEQQYIDDTYDGYNNKGILKGNYVDEYIRKKKEKPYLPTMHANI
jgi:hypothetical protein